MLTSTFGNNSYFQRCTAVIRCLFILHFQLYLESINKISKPMNPCCSNEPPCFSKTAGEEAAFILDRLPVHHTNKQRQTAGRNQESSRCKVTGLTSSPAPLLYPDEQDSFTISNRNWLKPRAEGFITFLRTWWDVMRIIFQFADLHFHFLCSAVAESSPT